ncbi:MAG TPA: glycosyltransferase family A protein [Chloroflexia bacterium]|nr:glycosyltransferase family A protein [Chloroflexia bacterium]
MSATVDILIPTYNRPAALAVTLAALIGQTFHDFRVVVSDQTEDSNAADSGEVRAAVYVLEHQGRLVEIHKHLPRRGLAEQRQFLLDQATAPYALFIDDDVIMEPFVVGQMYRALTEEGCGFVGSALTGLSYREVYRPHQEAIEFWEGPVQPEVVEHGSAQWERYQLHNAANLYHVQQRLGLTPEQTRKYKVAWVGGCVMYDVAKLREAGSFSFWQELPPEHCGEDVLAQLRVMARSGGCGLIPSGAFHQELPTTVTNREVDAPKVLR